MMSTTKSSNLVYGSLMIGSCAVICLCFAIVASAQYNTFDSDSNSDSEGSPILTNAELGKLVRNSARQQAEQRHNNQQLAGTATRNLYNRQQPMQYAPTHNNRRNYGDASGLGGGFSGPSSLGAAASHGRGSNADSDDDEGGNFGPNFGSNFDSNDEAGEGSGAGGNGEREPMNLNSAASGYPGQGDYSGEGAGAGFGFGAGGFGPSGADGADFGPAEAGFGSGGDGRRAKAASSLMGSRGFGSGADDDAGAPQYGPNSAINADDDEGRSGYAPEASSQGGSGDDDDE